MIGIVITVFVFSYVIFYCIYGTFLSRKLALLIGYDDGFLMLWNKIQFSIVSPITQLPEFSTPESRMLYLRLLALIKVSYVVIISGVILSFFTDVANL